MARVTKLRHRVAHTMKTGQTQTEWAHRSMIRSWMGGAHVPWWAFQGPLAWLVWQWTQMLYCVLNACCS